MCAQGSTPTRTSAARRRSCGRSAAGVRAEPSAGAERLGGVPGEFRLDPDDLRVREAGRRSPPRCRRSARRRTPGTSTHGDIGCVLGDLQPDRALAGDHIRVVERRHHRLAGLRLQFLGAGEPLLQRHQFDCGAQRSRSPSILRWGALSGMTMCASTPNARAAYATAWAWLPEEWARMPRALTSGSRRATAFTAPRILKAPIGCSDSGFSHRSGHGERSSGVRTAWPRIRSAARGSRRG